MSELDKNIKSYNMTKYNHFYKFKRFVSIVQ